MSDEEVEVLCKDGCGETFKTFLKEMNEQNTRVICPKCGKAHEHPGSGRPGREGSAKSG